MGLIKYVLIGMGILFIGFLIYLYYYTKNKEWGKKKQGWKLPKISK